MICGITFYCFACLGQRFHHPSVACNLPHVCRNTLRYDCLSNYRRSSPITLLVLAEVTGEHGAGPVFFCHGECGLAQGVVLREAAGRRGGFPCNRRTVFGDLDEFGSDQCIQPDQVCEHLSGLHILHAEQVKRPGILRMGKGNLNPPQIKISWEDNELS